MTLLLIARRELAHHLNSGLAPILLLVFVIAMPIPIYWANTPTNLFINGHVDLRAFFAMFPLYLMVLVPCLAMRTWSEERAQGTLETLLTMPLGETELVLGKFLGNYLLLVVAVGSNYGLFFDRAEGQADLEPSTVAAMGVANLTTTLGFGVLGFSTVPVLHAMGVTVGPGAVLVLLLAAMFKR